MGRGVILEREVTIAGILRVLRLTGLVLLSSGLLGIGFPLAVNGFAGTLTQEGVEDKLLKEKTKEEAFKALKEFEAKWEHRQKLSNL